MVYGAVEATIDRVQGTNIWLTIGLREGKNREVRRVLEHLGLSREPADPRLLRAVPARRLEARRGGGGARARAARPARREACRGGGRRFRRAAPRGARRSRSPSPKAARRGSAPQAQGRRMRIVGGRLRGRAARRPALQVRSARPATGCARRSSTSSRTPTGCRRRRRACSTFSPAPARSALKRSRAARRRRFSWRQASKGAASSAKHRDAGADRRHPHPAPRRDRSRQGRHDPALRPRLLDPPYGKGLGEKALQSAAEGRLAEARRALRAGGAGGGRRSRCRAAFEDARPARSPATASSSSSRFAVEIARGVRPAAPPMWRDAEDLHVLLHAAQLRASCASTAKGARLVLHARRRR